jgi:hypothetical protein
VSDENPRVRQGAVRTLQAASGQGREEGSRGARSAAIVQEGQVKRLRKFFRERFCRHDFSLMVNHEDHRLCLIFGCPKCGKLIGHFHLPAPRPSPETRIH